MIVVGTPAEDGDERYDDLLARASDAEPTPRPTRADDPLLLYFTSGTVAAPKMVLHTHASMGAGHEITARFWQDLTPADLHWTFSDTGWAKAAWGKLFGQWRMGASVFLWDQRGKLDPELCLRVLERSGVTTFCAPPTLFRAFVQLDLGAFDLARVRHTVSAGEPLNPEVIRAWREATGTTIYDGYGQTETVNLVANFPCLEVRPGSMGKPTPGNDVDVVSDDGERLAPGEEGNIALATEPERPVGLMQGYWRDDDANAEVFHDGWYFTGDRAVKDEDGYFWFVSRSDDVIISASYRIGPFEVESALVEHPAVVESAVVGKPDPERTSIVKAFVVLAPGYEGSDALARELQEHVKTVTAPYKYPREIEFVDVAAEDDLRQDPAQRAARSARDAAAAVRDRALLRGARVRRAVSAVRLRRRGALHATSCSGTADDEMRDALGRPLAGLHRDARLAAPACGDRRPLRDAHGRRHDRRRRGQRGALPARSRRSCARAITWSRCGPPTSRSTTSRARRAPRWTSSSCGRRTAGRSTSTESPPPCGRHARGGRQLPAQPDRHAPERRRSSTSSSELVESHGATLVCDEVYRGLEQDPRCPPARRRRPLGRAPSASACSRSRTRSPACAWAGWRRATASCSTPSRRSATTRRSAARRPPRCSASIALRAADALVERSRAIIAANLPLVDALLAEHAERLDWVRPSAGSIGFPRYLGSEGIDAFNDRLVREQGVLLLPGRVYGYGDGRFRLGFGRSNLPEAVERLDRQLRA